MNTEISRHQTGSVFDRGALPALPERGTPRELAGVYAGLAQRAAMSLDEVAAQFADPNRHSYNEKKAIVAELACRGGCDDLLEAMISAVSQTSDSEMRGLVGAALQAARNAGGERQPVRAGDDECLGLGHS